MNVNVPFFGGRVDGEDPALIDAGNGQTVNYRELSDRVDEVADSIERTCGQRAVVACEPSRTVDDVVFYLGAAAGGNVVLLVDPDAPSERKRQLYARFRPHLRPAGVSTGGPKPAVVAGRDYIVNEAAPATHPDLALLLSTSGSTASPKLVRLSRGAVTSNAAAIAAALGLGPGERALASLPMAFSYGLSVLNSHLTAGATVVLSTRTVAERALWESVAKYACTSMAGVPATYRILHRLRLFDWLGPIRTLTQAGGRLDDITLNELRAHARSSGRALVVMYGQTEATARITVLPSSEIDARPSSVGTPIQGTIEIIVDCEDEGSTCGEISYEGPNVMMGYASAADDLAKPDQLGSKLSTGDLGRLDEEGYLYIVGRRSRVAKVDGNRLNLDEIEGAIAHLGPFYIVDVEGGLVLAYEQDEVDVALVREALAELFNVRTRSWEMRRIERTPLTSHGKVDYAALAQTVAE
jgi:acyl-CoA synthetase (AMP-forming)/AMP-acid ligase II